MTGCFLQIAWSLGGAIVVLSLGIAIFLGPSWTLGWKDLAYWLAVAGVVAARHLDVARYGGRTTLGEPATARDVRRFAGGVLAVAAAGWCVAQAVDA